MTSELPFINYCEALITLFTSKDGGIQFVLLDCLHLCECNKMSHDEIIMSITICNNVICGMFVYLL